MLSKPKSCSGCALATLGRGFSETEGNGASGVMIVGEALGDREVADGLPFRPHAPAGSVLQTAIKRSGLDRDELTLTNVVRCGPPGNKLENMPWENGAVAHCQKHMDPVIERARPKVIYALGNSAIKALTGLSGKARGSTSLRGYVLKGTRYPGIPVVAGLHPAFIARGARENIEVLRHDLLKAVGIAKGSTKERFVDYETHCPCRTNVPQGHDLLPASPFCRICNGSGKVIKQRTISSNAPASYLFIETWEDAITAGLDYRRPPSLAEYELDELYNLLAYSDAPNILAVDIETEMIKSRNRSEMVANLSDKIKSIQFSIAPDSGYFLPWVEPWITWAKKLLALPVKKTGWNCDGFDFPILKAAGCEIAGETFDGMTAWHHMQPDLLKDLQFAGSFLGARYPWDHLKDSQPELYATADADNTIRAAIKLPEQMKKLGIWDSYVVQVQGLRPVLDRITARGLPVDEERLETFGVELDGQIAEVDGKCQALWPIDLRKYHPSEGYKVLPKPLKEALKGVILGGGLGKITVADEVYVERKFQVTITEKDAKTRGLAFLGPAYDANQPSPKFTATRTEVRWCKPLPFLPNSWQQIQAYMKFKGHPIPKNVDGKDTTGTKELDRLAKKTKDPLYTLIGQYRKVRKMKSTYVGEPETKSRGFRPEPDGRVRAYYTYNPATGQLATSGGPPLLTIPKHGALAPAFRRCFHAEQGHKFVTFDYKGFHSLTTGFEANDSDYMRLARIDIHSFVTGHSLRLPGREKWLGLPDEELTLVLADIKKKHKAIRDGRIKNSTHGRQFGLGPMKFFDMNRESFNSLKEVKELFALLDDLFPKTFIEYPKRVRDQAHRSHYLLSEYGYIRWFWEVYKYDMRNGGWTLGEDAEAALSFLPSNGAFGMARDALLDVNAAGFDQKYELVNYVHDEFVFHPLDGLIEECVENIRPIMEKPSRKLISALVPGGLICKVDAGVGEDLASMSEIRI